jgi:nitrogen fixation protein FixH
MTFVMRRHRAAHRGGWIPWAFIGFFGVVLAANGVMVWLAFASWTGLDTARAYQQGLAYNGTLEAARQQAALGWQIGFAFAQTGKREALLEVSLEDAHGDLLEQAEVRATIVRPTHAGYDFALRLPHHHAGRYRAALDLPLPGQWEVRIVAAEGGDTYHFTRRVYVRP